METVETYRKLVQHMLQAHANAEEGTEGVGVEVQLVCDTVHYHCQLWYIRWQDEHCIRGCVLQVDIKDRKIWIQYDGTEMGLASALVQAGFPNALPQGLLCKRLCWERHAPAWLLEPGWRPALPG